MIVTESHTRCRGDGPDGVRLGARRQHRIGDRNVALVDADVPVLDEVAHRPADERVRRCAQGVDVAADESAPGDAVDVEEDEIGGGTRRPAEVARPSQREWRPLRVVQLQVPRTVATAAPDFAGKTRFHPMSTTMMSSGALVWRWSADNVRRRCRCRPAATITTATLISAPWPCGVCDIFTQINSRGIRLDVFDLMNALLKPHGPQLKHMWREAATRLEFVESERLNVYVLQVMSILRQAYCSPKYLYYLLPGQTRQVREADGSLRAEVLVADEQEFAAGWHVAVDALERAINLLRHPQEFGAASSAYLPYVSVLPAFASLQEAAKNLPASRRLDAQRKVRHWYWASVFTNRYSGSVESTTSRDYLEVRKWFDDDLAEPSLIAEFRGRFRTLDLRKETKRGTSVYNGIFNLLVLRGARDWMTGNVPQPGDLDDHHIVPKRWGRDHSVGSMIDSILNRSPLIADTNRNVIKDRLPNEYLPELIAQNGDHTVRATLESHFVSPAALEILLRSPFGPQDFASFLDERQRTIFAAIEDLLIKERLDLSPQLRELDGQVEDVELGIRRVISERLEGDSNLLPEHVKRKITERLTAAARRNPTVDDAHYDTLSGMLEYADLRELQEIIASRSLWDRFADIFSTKEQLANRFNQLGELRNAIRHSRSVDEVTRRDGEAALAWFSTLAPLTTTR